MVPVVGLPAALGQCRRQPGELVNRSLDGFRPHGDVPFEPHPRCSRQKDKPVLSHGLIFLVPVVGLEPTRCRQQRILSFTDHLKQGAFK